MFCACQWFYEKFWDWKRWIISIYCIRDTRYVSFQLKWSRLHFFRGFSTNLFLVRSNPTISPIPIRRIHRFDLERSDETSSKHLDWSYDLVSCLSVPCNTWTSRLCFRL
jgi:hypothetical protein